MPQQELENQEEQARKKLLTINLEALKERKMEFSLMLWEMAELYQVSNEGADEETIQQFQTDCITLRQILKYI